MAMVNISDIDVRGRSRRDMGDIASLAASIEKIGLLHPVVISSDGKLIAGRRRIEAFKTLNRDKIPANTVRNLNEVSLLLQAEKDENTCRKSYTPSEAVDLGKKIEKTLKPLADAAKKEGRKRGGGDRRSEEAKRSTGISRRANGDRQAEEARTVKAQAASAVGMDRRTYEKAKAVIESGEKDLIEEMNRTGKVAGAHNKMKKRKQSREAEEAAAKARQEQHESERPTWTIINMDVMDGLQSIADEWGPARLIVTDPPYNIGIDYGRGKKADMLSPDAYMEWVRQWLSLCVECLTDDGSLWVVIGDEYAADYCLALRELGLTIRNWIKWYETFGVNCADKFNRTSRHIFYCVWDPANFVFNTEPVTRPSDRQAKYGDKRASPDGKLWDDVWQIPRLTGTCKERVQEVPTQLPLSLVRPIIECASMPGDLVVDPFAGSGTTGVAAMELGRKYAGVDISNEFSQVAEQRIVVAQRWDMQ